MTWKQELKAAEGRRCLVNSRGEPITAPLNTVTDFTSDSKEKRMTKEATEKGLEALFMQIREEREGK